MWDQLKAKIKQPRSLKWKWGVLLFIVISLLGTTLLGIYHSRTIDNQKQYLRDQTQAQVESVQSLLERGTVPYGTIEPGSEFTAIGTMQIQEQRLILRTIQYLEQDEYVIRLYTPNNDLAYETDILDVPPIEETDEVTVVEGDDGDYLIARNSITSNDSGLMLGYVETILRPEMYSNMSAQQNRLLFYLFIAMIVVVLILAVVIANRFLRPLTYLNNSLDLVEEESLSDIRVRKPRSNDEWSDLSMHVNKLLDKIDLYVTNQKQFVEDVSHELRTPVAVVEGHLKLLNRWGKDDPEVLEESISASLQEMTRMKLLVQEMLDLSRADHVDVDYKDEITEIYSTTHQVFNNFKLIHPSFSFYIDSDDREGQELYVRMFKNHYEQILIILMDNAVKYSADRKEIHLSINKGVTRVEIAVQDFGEGMSEENKQKVFGRFYRVDKARSREKGGTGLGLSIAKQLVNSYKGSIWVDSVIDQGSIFYIEFPFMTDETQIEKSKQIKASRPNVETSSSIDHMDLKPKSEE